MFSFFRRNDPDTLPTHIRAMLIYTVEPIWSAQRKDYQDKGCPASHVFTITDQGFCWLTKQESQFASNGASPGA